MKRIFSIVFIAIVALTVSLQATAQLKSTYKKALIIGAHPDDPETCAGGTMVLLKQLGCDVVSVYLTTGEGGIQGKSHEDAAAIRRIEGDNACATMGVRSVWVGQIDGYAEVNRARFDEMKRIIDAEKPDVVFTHWPIDSHRDHRVCSVLVYDAWRQLGHSFDLYYMEAMTGCQTQNFAPDTYVDISSTVDIKHKAIMCHESQNPPEIISDWHGPMEKMRGHEFQCRAAEAFVLQRWHKGL